MTNKTILVAGATGNLGFRIVKYLLLNGANVKALCRPKSDPLKIQNLKNLGAEVIQLEFDNLQELTAHCQGVGCIVSAVSGLADSIISGQSKLLEAALAAGVPRFIPSDFSIDFTKLSFGQNRNLDFRKTFHKTLETAPIAATSIFNGAFADMLTNEMPLILYKIKRVLCWGHPNQAMDFTSIENTAEYTAKVALDTDTPRYLYIAGSQVSAQDTAKIASEVFNENYKILKPGGLGLFGFIIKIARKFDSTENELYPAWQGMQYMHNMMEGKVKFANINNNRYPDIKWTSIKDLLLNFKNH
jgi:NmrA-like family